MRFTSLTTIAYACFTLVTALPAAATPTAAAENKREAAPIMWWIKEQPGFDGIKREVETGPAPTSEQRTVAAEKREADPEPEPIMWWIKEQPGFDAI